MSDRCRWHTERVPEIHAAEPQKILNFWLWVSTYKNDLLFVWGGDVTRAAFYLRVSTGEQTVENQRQALQAVAELRGWQVAAIYRDDGISGSKTRLARPGLDQMLKDAPTPQIRRCSRLVD